MPKVNPWIVQLKKCAKEYQKQKKNNQKKNKSVSKEKKILNKMNNKWWS